MSPGRSERGEKKKKKNKILNKAKTPSSLCFKKKKKKGWEFPREKPAKSVGKQGQRRHSEEPHESHFQGEQNKTFPGQVMCQPSEQQAFLGLEFPPAQLVWVFFFFFCYFFRRVKSRAGPRHGDQKAPREGTNPQPPADQALPSTKLGL